MEKYEKELNFINEPGLFRIISNYATIALDDIVFSKNNDFYKMISNRSDIPFKDGFYSKNSDLFDLMINQLNKKGYSDFTDNFKQKGIRNYNETISFIKDEYKKQKISKETAIETIGIISVNYNDKDIIKVDGLEKSGYAVLINSVKFKELFTDYLFNRDFYPSRYLKCENSGNMVLFNSEDEGVVSFGFDKGNFYFDECETATIPTTSGKFEGFVGNDGWSEPEGVWLIKNPEDLKPTNFISKAVVYKKPLKESLISCEDYDEDDYIIGEVEINKSNAPLYELVNVNVKNTVLTYSAIDDNYYVGHSYFSEEIEEQFEQQGQILPETYDSDNFNLLNQTLFTENEIEQIKELFRHNNFDIENNFERREVKFTK